ncbi:Pre-mRNA-splicing factor SYF1 [[Candida] zeylanoides]
MAWDLDRLIPTDDDIAFEQGLVKNPTDFALWLKYYRSVPEQDTHRQAFILHRAVSTLPRSYKLWTLYLELRTKTRAGGTALRSLNVLFGRCLQWLHKFPLIWTRYLHYLMQTQASSARFLGQQFHRSLVALPSSQHHHIWPLYLEFANKVGGAAAVKIYRNFLKFEPPPYLQTRENDYGVAIDDIISLLVSFGGIGEAAELFEEVFERHRWSNYLLMETSAVKLCIDFVDRLTPGGTRNAYIDSIISRAIARFPDQIGNLYIKHATYYLRNSNHHRARSIFAQGIKQCVTVHDFVMVFDAYTDFEEGLIEKMVNDGADNDEISFRMDFLESLYNNRAIYLSDMMIKQDPNNIDEWMKRIAEYERHGDINRVLQTYAQALTTINPLKSHSVSGRADNTLPRLWINYANVYASKRDYGTAVIVLSKAVQSQFRHPDDLVKLYIAWSEIELQKGDFDSALKVIEDACLYVPSHKDDSTTSYNDNSLDIHARVHKSTKLWDFYLDLLESAIDDGAPAEIERVCLAYEKLIQLKIVTPLHVLNYAKFLEDWRLIDKSFAVYEMGVNLFKFPVSFEIWNVYLTKAVQSFKTFGVERTRDLFEQCLKVCPPNLATPVYVLYSNFEETNGLILKSIRILKSGVRKLEEAETPASVVTAKCELYTLLVAKSIQIEDIEGTRAIYESIMSDAALSYPQLVQFAFRFIEFETTNNQFTRVRSVFKYLAGLKPPSESDTVWDKWEAFELTHGDENTFKDMLRFKRIIYSQFEQELVAQRLEAPKGFVKATIPVENKSEDDSASTAQKANPDEIELSME